MKDTHNTHFGEKRLIAFAGGFESILNMFGSPEQKEPKPQNNEEKKPAPLKPSKQELQQRKQKEQAEKKGDLSAAEAKLDAVIVNNNENTNVVNLTVNTAPAQAPEATPEDLSLLTNIKSDYRSKVMSRLPKRIGDDVLENIKNEAVIRYNTYLKQNNSAWRVTGGPAGSPELYPYHMETEQPPPVSELDLRTQKRISYFQNKANRNNTQNESQKVEWLNKQLSRENINSVQFVAGVPGIAGVRLVRKIEGSS